MIAPGKVHRAVFAALIFAAAAQAATLKLPPKYALLKSPKSPGTVHFNHATHVLEDEPNCVACHPKTFSILQANEGIGKVQLTHKLMEQGKACGACHGKVAFKLSNCKNCHD